MGCAPFTILPICGASSAKQGLRPFCTKRAPSRKTGLTHVGQPVCMTDEVVFFEGDEVVSDIGKQMSFCEPRCFFMTVCTGKRFLGFIFQLFCLGFFLYVFGLFLFSSFLLL